jgi:diguanylate cyclase (GGDEF)-like protein/PAS domain S-box-containing protein
MPFIFDRIFAGGYIMQDRTDIKDTNKSSKWTLNKIIAYAVICASVLLCALATIGAKFYFGGDGYLWELILAIVILLIIIIPNMIFSFNRWEKLKNTEQELINSKEKYQSVINNMHEVIFQTDTSGNFTILNPAWVKVTGFTQEESLGKNFSQYIFPKNKKMGNKVFELLITGKRYYCRYEMKCLSKSGNLFWVELNAQTNFDGFGNITGVSGTLRDITTKKIMENEIYKKDRLLQGISEAANILLLTSNYESAFNNALEKLGDVTDSDRVYLFKIDSKPGSRSPSATLAYEWCGEGIEAWINNPIAKNFDYDENEVMGWYDTLSEGNIISGLKSKLPQYGQNILEKRKIKSLLVIPIFIENNLWGSLGFNDCTKERSWSSVEKTALLAAAASMSGAVKRMEDEEALEKAHQNDFNQIVKNLQNLVFKVKRDLEGEFYYTLFEGKVAENAGITTQNIAGKRLAEFLPEGKAKYVEEYYKRAFEGEFCSYEFEMNKCLYYASLSPIYMGNKVVEVIGSAVDITENREAQKKIRQMAYYDELTKLPNRTLLKERLNNSLIAAEKDNGLLGVMFFDLDNFKKVNDTLGHAVGDSLIGKVAARLTDIVEQGDTISRMGGDEFILLMPEIKSEEEAANKAKNIIESFKDSFIIEGNELFITPSIGISIYPRDGQDSETLIKNADMAMYKAKEFGKNNYQFYSDTMNEMAVEKLKLENDLRKAIDNNEFFLVYQPRVNLPTGMMIGCEALIRWRHPELGIIPPVKFISIAEESGLIVPLGKWVLQTACRQNKSWQDSGYNKIVISVNISVKQLYQENILDMVQGILDDTGLEPKYLEFEITENVMMHNTEKMLKIMQRIKALGISISIDDFGTGFSSLSYLKQFSADIIKIDRAFIKDVNSNPNDAAITSAIINMAHSLNLRVIAEGVENHEQLGFLKSKNCNEVQGYLCGKPIMKDEFRELLSENKNLVMEDA